MNLIKVSQSVRGIVKFKIFNECDCHGGCDCLVNQCQKFDYFSPNKLPGLTYVVDRTKGKSWSALEERWWSALDWAVGSGASGGGRGGRWLVWVRVWKVEEGF